MTQVRGIEALAELRCQGLGQTGDESLAIGCACGTALLELDIVATDLPTGLDLDRVGTAQDAGPGVLDQGAQLAEQTGERLIGGKACLPQLRVAHPRCPFTRQIINPSRARVAAT